MRQLFFLLPFFPQIQWDASCFYPGVHLCGLDLSQLCLSLISVLTRNQGKTWGGLFTAVVLATSLDVGSRWCLLTLYFSECNKCDDKKERSLLPALRGKYLWSRRFFYADKNGGWSCKTWHFKIRVQFIDLEEHLGRTVNVHLAMGKLLYFLGLKYFVGRNEELPHL